MANQLLTASAAIPFRGSAAAPIDQLIVADALCPRIHSLLDGALHPSVGVGQGCDPIEAITAAIGPRRLHTLHLVAHGRPGAFLLGGRWLDASALTARAAELATWNVERIALWSCEVGADANFVSLLSELTGAEVFASPTLIEGGAANSWRLMAKAEDSVLESPVAFSLGTISTWQGQLAIFPDPGGSNAPRSVLIGDSVSGEVFLGGTFIELGLASVGSFGTSGSFPAGFFGTSAPDTRLGMSADADAFGVGDDRRIDFFIPGSPEERWSIGFLASAGSGSQRFAGFSRLQDGGNSGRTSGGISFTTDSIANTSSGDVLAATLSGTLVVDGSNFLKVDFVHFFGKDQKLFTTNVTLTNLTDFPISGLRFMRSHDPDNTKYYNNDAGSFTTDNTVVRQASVSGFSFVQATSLASEAYNNDFGDPALIGYFSTDPRSYVYFGGFTNPNPFSIGGGFDPVASPLSEGAANTDDEAIGIIFNLSDLAPGASTAFSYKTVLDFDTAGEIINPPTPELPPVVPPVVVKDDGLRSVLSSPTNSAEVGDNRTANGLARFEVVAASGLASKLSLLGARGEALEAGKHYTVQELTVSSEPGKSVYLINLVDANLSKGGKQSFGSFYKGKKTGNNANTRDGTYTLQLDGSAIDTFQLKTKKLSDDTRTECIANIKDLASKLFGYRVLQKKGTKGDDLLIGKTGSDKFNGRDGSDLLNGFGDRFSGSSIDSGFGTNQVDELIGGKGRDYFQLADILGSFYTGDASNGYARIADFDGKDALILQGSAANYTLRATSVDGNSGIGLFTAQNDDLVALLQGKGAEGFNLANSSQAIYL